MKEKGWKSSIARRLFLSKLGAGAGVVGAAVISSAAAAQMPANTTWRPARHAQDDWLEQISGQHRFVFDTNMPEGLSMAIQFAGNYFMANEDGYGLKNSDLAVVIVLRHRTTEFGFNDTMWAKYGKYFSEHSGFTDPRTKEAPAFNFHATPGGGERRPGRMVELIQRGVHFAVCQRATRNLTERIARDNGGDAEAVYKEIVANLIANSHMVPAGIVAVNRAQERGYSFVHGV
jgi:intracellular sulfur oxidation DsrE/DsrF family protein